MRIGRDDPVTDRLQGNLRAFLLAKQRFLVELPLGHVELDTHQPQQAAMFVDARGGTAYNPTPLAVAMAHAVGAFEDRGLAGHVIPNRRLDPRQIIGMNQAAPIRRAAHILVGVAEHGLPTG